MCKSAVSNQASAVMQRNGPRLCFPFIFTASNTAYLSTEIYYIFKAQIQGDSGGICNTLGNDSMCDSKQKSSYEHGPNLNGYGVMTS
jgi:hypothetical protein